MSQGKIKPDAVLDMSGLRCPLPVLKAKKAIRQMQPGQVLKLIATDPAAEQDIPQFCKITNHRLLETANHDGKYIFHIQKV